jgi:hypothetical protein
MRSTHEKITIRLLGDEDFEAVARLAAMDSAAVPEAPLVGAYRDGRLLVARSLGSGESIADPWTPTSELRALLDERATQLSGGNGRRWFRRPRARAALPASPPGAGGRLLDLDARPT